MITIPYYYNYQYMCYTWLCMGEEGLKAPVIFGNELVSPKCVKTSKFSVIFMKF